MTDKQVTTVIGIIYSIGAVMVLVGAFFRLQHYPHGLSILFSGFVLGTVTSSYDVFRLKKKIKRLEKQLHQNMD
ncbi:LapA family protein [uncultured Draconibacterium sp.]|uniref:LapA family protein n=1 Tax=uncultured Draconibacterium sp. TaxID=1573823 RepID=UPI002AA7ADA0|nr:LapA family protein [uncultured Draconibacterium sp.]